MSTLAIEHSPITKPTPIEYPTSDGQPMAETEVHILAILQLLSALRLYFRKQDVYVVGNMFLYYREGNAKARKAPDLMVVKNVGKQDRRSFKTWEEKATPCVIFEITSKETTSEDTVSKPSLYASLGVQEYFLFDPLHEYLEQQFMGYQLVDGEYVLLPSNEDGEIFSTELQAILRPEGKLLRVIEPTSGQPVPSLDEAVDLAEQEAQRAAVAEAENVRLRTEIAALRQQRT
ncbi:MAG: Uma2 family endonuclease [Caldilineaceae bacterium]|nr:Uma2 family endonuclease [Caldilineaceae bacterium]